MSDFRNLKTSYFFDPFRAVEKHSKTGEASVFSSRH